MNSRPIDDAAVLQGKPGSGQDRQCCHTSLPSESGAPKCEHVSANANTWSPRRTSKMGHHVRRELGCRIRVRNSALPRELFWKHCTMRAIDAHPVLVHHFSAESSRDGHSHLAEDSGYAPGGARFLPLKEMRFQKVSIFFKQARRGLVASRPRKLRSADQCNNV